jgi:hypothetical protein
MEPSVAQEARAPGPVVASAAVGILGRLGTRGSSSALAGPRELFERFVEEAAAAADGSPPSAAQVILAAEPREQIEVLRRAVAFCSEPGDPDPANALAYTIERMGRAAAALANRLLRLPLPFTAEELIELLDGVLRAPGALSPRAALWAIERHLAGAPPAGALRPALENAADALRSRAGADSAELAARATSLLDGSGIGLVEIQPVDAWTRRVLECFADDPDLEEAATPLLRHAAAAKGSRPSPRWSREAALHVSALGSERHRALLGAALGALAAPLPESPDGPDPAFVAERHADLLRGLVWSAAGDEALSAALGGAAERCFAKRASAGPRAPKIGNACLHALAACDARDALAELTRLRASVRSARVRRRIDQAFAELAERTGRSSAELEEVGVPTAGLGAVGLREQPLGELTAELRLRPGAAPTLAWRKPSGRYQKNLPVALKVLHAETLLALRKSRRDLRRLVPGQRARLERQLLEPRELPCSVWRERYADHPLVGFLARRLIWSLGSADARTLACFAGNRLVDVDGRALEPAAEHTVRLWHPIESAAEDVARWRDALDAREITQPFQQAHREPYALGEAERGTPSCSNRFAGHVLRPDVFRALCRERRWSGATRDVAQRGLPGGWRAELELEALPSGCVATRRLRFRRAGRTRPALLRNVPPLLLSETLRDVDLFTSLASVVCDPDWQDGGPRGVHATYWQQAAHGALGELARTRRGALERIVPRLKIAERCVLGERDLCVRGELGTYQIHLGSANVRLAPDGPFLRIPPSDDADLTPRGLALPFEGDPVLSRILARAFLLAADDRIRDRGLASELRRS